MTRIPNFFIASIAASTSSEINRFDDIDVPDARDANKTHLILRLLSPGTIISFLKFSIFFLIIKVLGIN